MRKGFGTVNLRAIEVEWAVEDVKGNPFGATPYLELPPCEGGVRDCDDYRHARVVGVGVWIGDGVKVDLDRAEFKG